MAQRSWAVPTSQQDVTSPSLACRIISRDRSASDQTDLLVNSPSCHIDRYFENPGKFRLAVRPGLEMSFNVGQRSPSLDGIPGCRLEDSLEELEHDKITAKKSGFTRAKNSLRLSKESIRSRSVPSISITNESDSTMEAKTSISPFPEAVEAKNVACGTSESKNFLLPVPTSSHDCSVMKPLPELINEKNLDVDVFSENSQPTKSNEKTTSGDGTDPCNTTKKVPVVTREMLEKHSYHYYLMHNFFLSESSSSSFSEDESNQDSPVTLVKKVNFKLEPEIIPLEPNQGPPDHCTCNQRNTTKFAYIQVAGTMFQTHWATLDKHADTLLGSQDKFQYYDFDREVFNFPHIRQDCFESILFYYQDGILRSPKGVKEEVFLAELDFFGIRHDKITVGPFEHELQENYDHAVPDDQDSLQAKVFLLLYHKCSTSTKVYTFIDIIVILTSVVSFLTATIPIYKPPGRSETERSLEVSETWTKDQMLFYSRFGAIKEFVIIDGICMVWFFAVFLLHYYAAPMKRSFLKSFQAGIDLILITAFATSIALAFSPLYQNSFLQTLVRLTFSLRILKLARHSLLLNSLGIALKEASRELISVLLFVFVIVFIFACFEYFVEVDEPTNKPKDLEESRVRCPANQTTHADCMHHEEEEEDHHASLMDYVWWSLITITTIGYGNTKIHTTAGKVVGALCAISGVPLFAIPIPILSKHLERVYQRELRRNKLLNLKMKLLAQRMSTERTSQNSDLSEIEETSDSEEAISWQRIVGTRRKSMGPQFAMTHFSNNTQ
ncbi:hypothetical protein ACHWQZ_G010492 [Mnemiopsis leidyi]